MRLIRKLNNGKWNKPPALTAARLVFAKGLAEKYPGRALGDLADFVNGTSYDRGRLDMGDTPIIRISIITDATSDFIATDEQFPASQHSLPSRISRRTCSEASGASAQGSATQDGNTIRFLRTEADSSAVANRKQRVA